MWATGHLRRILTAIKKTGEKRLANEYPGSLEVGSHAPLTASFRTEVKIGGGKGIGGFRGARTKDKVVFVQ